MPRLVRPEDAKEKWNFYFPKMLKLEMHRKLLDIGQQRRQSALLRALVRMFVNGDIDTTKLIPLMDEETYTKLDGTLSKL